MIRILISDDNNYKIKEIRKVIDEFAHEVSYEIASDLVTTRQYLSRDVFDLLILDLFIPNRSGDEPIPENGISFLNEIKRERRIKKPAHIIGLTEFDQYFQEFRLGFEDDLWALIRYEAASTHWAQQIRSKISYLISNKNDKKDSAVNYLYDICIVTALATPELESILNLPGEWVVHAIPNDSTQYHCGTFSSFGKKISVVAAAAPQMGMVASSVLSMKMISHFRPKYLVMTGIAAGVRRVGEYGDILVADISFDSGSGKIKTLPDGTSKFEPDYRSIPLDIDIRDNLLACKSNRDFLDQIKRNWPGDKPSSELNIHIGPFASGAGVVENKKVIEDIQGFSRKLIGIDMETYGVYYAAKNCSKPRPLSVFSIKSITDYADPDKNDSFQKYAAYTSANYFYRFVTEKIDISL